MKLSKKIVAWLLITVMALGLLPMNVQAANDGESHEHWLYKDMEYSGVDLDKDGYNDTVKFIGVYKSYFLLSINKVVFKLQGRPGSSYDDNKVLLFEVANDGVYVITSSYEQDKDKACTRIYRYNRKKCREIKEIRQLRYFNINKMHIVGTDNDKLIVRSMRSERINSGGLLTSFKNTQEDVSIVVPYRFRNGTVNMYPSIVGRYCQSSSSFLSMQKFFTSSTAYLRDSNGPIVKKGDKVELLGFAIISNEIRCKISVNGKVGWFKNSFRIRLYDL